MGTFRLNLLKSANDTPTAEHVYASHILVDDHLELVCEREGRFPPLQHALIVGIDGQPWVVHISVMCV